MSNNKMLIDATHPEETRVVVLREGRVEEFDYESAARKPLRGNIYLAKVTRVEPSLQAAFVEYGGNRHGFLAFSEIHPDYYQIPVADREALKAEEARAEAEAEAAAEARAEKRARASTRSRGRPRKRDRNPAVDAGDDTAGLDPQDAREALDDGALADRHAAPETVDADHSGDGDVGDEAPARDRGEDRIGAARADVGDDVEADRTLDEQEGDDPGRDDPQEDATGQRGRARAADLDGADPVVRAEADHDADSNADEADAEARAADDDRAGDADSDDADAAIEAAGDDDPDDTDAGEQPPGPVEASRRTGGRGSSRRRGTRRGRNGAAASDLSEDDDADADLDGDEGDDAQASGDQPDADDVEQVGSEDALEELPERPRRRARQYKIQEVIRRRQVILIQVVKEERGNKGAALTTYLSLAGRYTVLMPNTGRGGGISRKITNAADRKRLKAIALDLEVPEGMGLIVRTAGAARTRPEIKRDYEYLLRLWENIRDVTLRSTAPNLVYEEGNLIKRSIRDLYSKEIDQITVAGDQAYKEAKSFMTMLMPSHTKNVRRYENAEPLFAKFQIERQLNAMFNPHVTLPSGGYLVINQTEALVSVDVNSGKSTREFSIEETALNTNLEAATELSRQLKLRDLAGLIVIDFIDMEEKRNNRAVERRLKDALKYDRARIQVGRISHFGLLEMSRQRLRTGVLEGSTTQCPHCSGTGVIRSTESVALAVLRGLEDALIQGGRHGLCATTNAECALYLLNFKRMFINEMEERYGVAVHIEANPKMQGATFAIEKISAAAHPIRKVMRAAVNIESGFADDDEDEVANEEGDDNGEGGRSRRRRRRRGGRRGEQDEALRDDETVAARPGDRGGDRPGERGGDRPFDRDADQDEDDASGDSAEARVNGDGEDGDGRDGRRRRRGRRGGRRNREKRAAANGHDPEGSDDRASAPSVEDGTRDDDGDGGRAETDADAYDADSEHVSFDAQAAGQAVDGDGDVTVDADVEAADGEDGDDRPAPARRRTRGTRSRTRSTRTARTRGGGRLRGAAAAAAGAASDDVAADAEADDDERVKNDAVNDAGSAHATPLPAAHEDASDHEGNGSAQAQAEAKAQAEAQRLTRQREHPATLSADGDHEKDGEPTLSEAEGSGGNGVPAPVSSNGAAEATAVAPAPAPAAADDAVSGAVSEEPSDPPRPAAPAKRGWWQRRFLGD
ncbi:MAG: Rne/Rng family ribonuclease [Pseudomonadota bacterium]